MIHPLYTADVRSACGDACAEYGEPPCHEIDDGPPCATCLLKCGVEIPTPLDPAAVIAPLL